MNDVLEWIVEQTPNKLVGFPRRLCLQKASYMLKAFGHPLASRYSYSAYVHGPYSPALAEVYYGSLGAGMARRELYEWEQHNETVLPTVAEAIERGPDFLEGTATVHWFARKNPDKSKEEILNHVSGLKRHIERGDLEEGWRYLVKNDLIQERM